MHTSFCGNSINFRFIHGNVVPWDYFMNFVNESDLAIKQLEVRIRNQSKEINQKNEEINLLKLELLNSKKDALDKLRESNAKLEALINGIDSYDEIDHDLFLLFD
jgi:hypothetical protein